MRLFITFFIVQKKKVIAKNTFPTVNGIPDNLIPAFGNQILKNIVINNALNKNPFFSRSVTSSCRQNM